MHTKTLLYCNMYANTVLPLSLSLSLSLPLSLSLSLSLTHICVSALLQLKNGYGGGSSEVGMIPDFSLSPSLPLFLLPFPAPLPPSILSLSRQNTQQTSASNEKACI